MKILAGILFILCAPLSLFIFVRVANWTGSDFLGLLSGVFVYAGLALMIVAGFNKKHGMDCLGLWIQDPSKKDEISAPKDSSKEN